VILPSGWCDRLPAVLVLLKVLPRWVACLLLRIPVLGARLRRAAVGLTATTTWGPGGYGAPQRIKMVRSQNGMISPFIFEFISTNGFPSISLR